MDLKSDLIRHSIQQGRYHQVHKNLIYDVGMHNGDDTAYYLNRGFNVIAIEANPILATQAAERFKSEIDRGQLEILNVGIAESTGILDFWVCDSSSVLSSFDKNKASQFNSTCHSIKVSCQTFTSVLDQNGIPYYLKIDIEGKDDVCIDALSNKDLPKYVSVEIGDSLDKLEKLSALGYTRFKCISQLNFLPIQLPPARETNHSKLFSLLNLPGRALDKMIGRRIFSNRAMPSCWSGGWFFPFGCSGPFGEDTLGRWLTVEEMTDSHRHFKQLFDQKKASPFWRRDKYCSFWTDLHARRED